MVSFYRNIHIFTTLLLALLLFSACTNDKDVTDTQTVRLNLTISVGDATPVTRAGDWNNIDHPEAANANENYINPGMLHVVLYNATNNEFIAELQNMVVANVAGKDDVYNVSGDFDVTTAPNITSGNNDSLNCKIMVAANVERPQIETGVHPTLELFHDNALFEYSKFDNSRIPMWGVKQRNIGIKGGSNTDIGDIYVLRSLAKVKVQLTQDMIDRGYTLQSAALNNYNQLGYDLPGSTYSDIENLTDTRKLTYDDTFHPVTADTPLNGLEGTYSKDNITSYASKDFTLESGSQATSELYIPEYTNVDSEHPTTITVTIRASDGSTKTGTFEFGNYNNGNITERINIVRNHSYVFNVYFDDQIRLNLNVVPWTVIDHGDINL